MINYIIRTSATFPLFHYAMETVIVSQDLSFEIEDDVKELHSYYFFN